ncbi:polysaccharide lyase family 14 protein [Hebeloma cylindrosporum]|uniref:Polysaccharide lyase family 14 protein n=1 Tax=Hebeloma cylindrosporum TaxID=76867 RepID=A0A0C3CLW6_HEBCY|nr:polysaccharide lyase family 14 protein [Hebeloma cylindrosporum h7]
MFSSSSIILFLACLVVFSTASPVRQRRCPAVTASTPSPSVSSPPLNVVKGSVLPVPSSASNSRSSTPTSSSSTAASTPTSGSGGSSGPTIPGLLGSLFPVPGFSKSWTTSPSSDNALALSDAAFRPTNVLRSVPHTYVNAPDGKKAMKAHYPQGSYTFGNDPQGGFSFYAPGPSSLDLSTAKEATFGYSVYFPKGFAFNLGGKLPGLYGGNSEAEAVGCSGGRRSSACFSARLMWRSGGQGEFYTYLPPYTESRFAANRKVCNIAPASDCNPTYGASVGRGAFTFATGAWTTISERVRLNDVGQANGEIQLFVNGKSVINVGGLILRDSAAGRIRGMQMQTFFGGSHPEFASPKNQDVFFSDFSAAITRTL